MNDDIRHWQRGERIHGSAWAIPSFHLARVMKVKAKVEDKGQLVLRQVVTEIVKRLDHIAEGVKWWEQNPKNKT